jgi:hypothetical protein
MSVIRLTSGAISLSISSHFPIMGKSTNVKPVMRGPWGQRSKHFQARPHYLIQIKDFFQSLTCNVWKGQPLTNESAISACQAPKPQPSKAWRVWRGWASGVPALP